MTPDISSIYVPSSGPNGSKLLIIGEAPGDEEEKKKEPFVGPNSIPLITSLSGYGYSKADFKIMNLCNYKPKGNRFELLIGSSKLDEGIEEIIEYIKTYRPNCILALGARPLYYICGITGGIHNFRGSILHTKLNSISPPVKVIPTFHPSFVVRTGKDYNKFDFDVRRAIDDSAYPEFNYPVLNCNVSPDPITVEEWRVEIQKADFLTVDIESIKKTTIITCVGFSPSPNTSYTIPFNTFTHAAIKEICENPSIKKAFQYGTFDIEMLHLNGIDVQNYTDDTLVAYHVMEPEMDRGLDFLTSIYTRIPYYKSYGRGHIPEEEKAWDEKMDKNELYIYNGKDCIATYQVIKGELADMSEDEKWIYEQEMKATRLAIKMGRNGLPIDIERKDLLLKAALLEWKKKQNILDIGCNAKDVNVNSKTQMPVLLYTKLGLPERMNDGKITTDENAIVSLIGYCQSQIDKVIKEETKLPWKYKISLLKLILEIRGIRKLISSYLDIKISHDGTLKCTFKTAATDTNRWACQKYVDKTGVNTQTFPRDAFEVAEEQLDPETIKTLWAQLQTEEAA